MLALTLIIVIILMPYVNAETIYQLGKPPPPAKVPPPLFQEVSVTSNPEPKAQEAGALLFISFSKLFIAIEALEHRNIAKANQLLEEVRDDLNTITDHYKYLQSHIRNRPISIRNLTSEEIKVIEKDLGPYGGEVPTNFRELANIAYKEVQRFTELINKVRFHNDSAKNRKTVREIIDGLNRNMLIGISISDIEAANRIEKKK